MADQSSASIVQRLVLRFAGRRGAAIERESRDWYVICANCGHERTYWDLGGVRAGAASRRKRIRIACPACGQRGWHRVEHRPST